jgi:hypothetical protein
MHPATVRTAQAPKERAEKSLKLDELFPLEAAGQGLASRHQQGREQLQRPAAVVPVSDPQGHSRAGGPRGTPQTGALG